MNKRFHRLFFLTVAVLALGSYLWIHCFGRTELCACTLSATLSEIDPWPSDIKNYPEANWERLISLADVVQTNNPQRVTEVLSECQDKWANSLNEEANDSKLFLLLRVVFELPENSTSKPTFFAGWVGWVTHIENKDGTLNMAWPVSWRSGRPELVGNLDGLEGIDARYTAPKEYQYFLKRYPFRKLNK